MFCKQCGQQILDQAAVCVHCGVATGVGCPAAPAVSRIAYILLALFLGGLGIHNFYAGYTGKGIAQLLLTVLSCGLFWIVVFIWNLVEICAVTADSRGVPFSA